MTTRRTLAHSTAGLLALLLLGLFWLQAAQAMPAFARQYDMSCTTCHAAFPRLNEFGEQFAAQNMKLPNWRDKTADTGDGRLALPSFPPIAVRAQAYFQVREAGVAETDNTGARTGEVREVDNDIQAPYLIKLLSSAPLSEHITYYFYGIMAEKGENGGMLIEDAWFRHDDAFGSGVGVQLGQFQVSDLMFARETRLTFQDFQAYRMAGITYDRGVLLDRGVGPVDVAFGVVNGNGISESETLDSAGYSRPDHAFDSNDDKPVFGRLGTDLGPVGIGLFGMSGTQEYATGNDGDKQVIGLDLSGKLGHNTYWFAQYLQNTWSDVVTAGTDYEWSGGFAGIDWVASDYWTFSALYNYADAGDLDGSATVYDGIDINSLAVTGSYYFMHNVKGIVEVNGDFLDKEDANALPYGHLTKEDYLLVGFDAAF